MIENPFLPAPTAAAAWAEGFTKGYLALSSPEPGENVGVDDIEAFNQGVAAGNQSAVVGIDFGDSCLAAAEEHGPLHPAGIAIDTAHIAFGVWEIFHLAKIAAGVAGIVYGVVCLAATLPHHTRPPEQVLPDLGEPLISALQNMGLDSMALFCGAGLDPLAHDCEIKLTPLFTSVEQARDAVLAMGRNPWLVVSWRTDQSNSFDVADSS